MNRFIGPTAHAAAYLRLRLENIEYLEEPLSRISNSWLFTDEQFQCLNSYSSDLEISVVYALESLLRFFK